MSTWTIPPGVIPLPCFQEHGGRRGTWGVPSVSRLAWVLFEVLWRATNHGRQRELVRVSVVRLREASRSALTVQPYCKAFVTNMADFLGDSTNCCQAAWHLLSGPPGPRPLGPGRVSA